MILQCYNGPLDGWSVNRDADYIEEEYRNRVLLDVDIDGVRGIYRLEPDPWRLVWVDGLEPLT